MANIGGINCDIVRGQAPDLKERSESWQFPGHDNYAAQQLGLGDSEFVFKAVKFDSYANVLTWAQDIYRKQGNIVSVVNDQGTTFTNCLLHKVSELSTTTALQPGTSKTTRGELKITGVKTN